MLKAGLWQPPWAQIADGNTETGQGSASQRCYSQALWSGDASLSEPLSLWNGDKIVATLCYRFNDDDQVPGVASST